MLSRVRKASAAGVHILGGQLGRGLHDRRFELTIGGHHSDAIKQSVTIKICSLLQQYGTRGQKA